MAPTWNQQGLLIFVISHPAELIATCWEFVMEETTPLKPSRCKQMLGRSEHSFKETPYKFIPHSKTFTTQRCEERQGPRAATDAWNGAFVQLDERPKTYDRIYISNHKSTANGFNLAPSTVFVPHLSSLWGYTPIPSAAGVALDRDELGVCAPAPLQRTSPERGGQKNPIEQTYKQGSLVLPWSEGWWLLLVGMKQLQLQSYVHRRLHLVEAGASLNEDHWWS